MLNLPLILAVLTTSCQWFLLVNGKALVTIEHYNQPAGITYESHQIPIGQRAGPSIKSTLLEQPPPTPPPPPPPQPTLQAPYKPTINHSRINHKNDQNVYPTLPTTTRPQQQSLSSRRTHITPSPRTEGFSPATATNTIRSQSYYHENDPTANPKPTKQAIYPNVRYYSAPQISISRSGQRGSSSSSISSSKSYYQQPQYSSPSAVPTHQQYSSPSAAPTHQQYSSPSAVPTHQQYANSRRGSYTDQRKSRIQSELPPCDDSTVEHQGRDVTDNVDDSEIIENPILSSAKPETEHDEDQVEEEEGALDEDNVLEYGGIDVQDAEEGITERVQPSSEPQPELQPHPQSQPPQPQSQTVNTNNVELRRPAIHQQFYDVEHKVIVRPVGSAVVELDYSNDKKADHGVEPTKQPDRTYLTPKKEEPAPSPPPPPPPPPSSPPSHPPPYSPPSHPTTYSPPSHPPTYSPPSQSPPVEYPPPTVVYQPQTPQIPYVPRYPTGIPTFANEPPFYDIQPHSYPHPYGHNHHHQHQTPNIYGQSPIYIRPTVSSYDPNLSVGSNEDDYITISSGPQYPPLGDNGGGSQHVHQLTPSQSPPIPLPHEPGYTGPAPCPPTDSEVIDTDKTPFVPPPTHEETPLSPSPPPTGVYPTQDPGPVTFDGSDYDDSDGLQHFDHEEVGRDEVDTNVGNNNDENDYDDVEDDFNDSVIIEAKNQNEKRKNSSDYTNAVNLSQKRKQSNQRTHQSYYDRPSYQNQQSQTDKIRAEISQRGDSHGNSQGDIFYHELPRVQNYKKINVNLRSHGTTTHSRLQSQSNNARLRNPSSKYQTTIYSQKNLTPDLKQRLLDLFSVKGGVTEIVYHPLESFTHFRKNSQSLENGLRGGGGGGVGNGDSNEYGRNVQARVISVTPIPDHASLVQAHEHSKIQRIVVSKPIENYKPEDYVDSNDYIHINVGRSSKQTAPAKLQSKVNNYG